MTETITHPATQAAQEGHDATGGYQSAAVRSEHVTVYALTISRDDANGPGPRPVTAPVTRHAHGLWTDGCLTGRVLLAIMVDDGRGSDGGGIRAALRVAKLIDGHDGQIASAVDDHIACELARHAA